MPRDIHLLQEVFTRDTCKGAIYGQILMEESKVMVPT